MKIYDCFMFFDEEMLLDLRLNYLNTYVDKFVIVESPYTHSGEKRSLLFDINKYKKFKDKISYIVADQQPDNILKISSGDTEDEKNSKYILNAAKRENFQRNCISKGVEKAEPEDIIMISDLDEIPNLETNNLKKIKNKLIFFKQKLFYYKFNLKLKSFDWFGTKACKKLSLKTPQWLRNIKDRKYPLWRLDILFSKNKYNDICFIDNGGWHFSYLKSAENIEKKLTSYLHHREYDINPLGRKKIQEMMKNREPVYNLSADMKKSKFEGGQQLVVTENNELPEYIQKNLTKYQNWIE